MRVLVSAVIPLVAVAITLEADVLPAAYDVSVSYYINATQTLNEGNYVLAGSGTSAVLSGCVLSTAVRTACATSFAAVGDLGSTSSMQDTSQSTIPGQYESSNGIEWFRDVVTVNGLPNGTYTVVPTVTVDGKGSWDFAAFPNTVGLGITEWAGDGTTILDQIFADATQSTYAASFTLQPITFQAGVPFDFMLGFGEAAFIYNTSVHGPGENSLVDANFLNTMAVTGLEFLDSNGNPVTGFSVDSALGGIYSTAGVVPTPEPSSVLLLMTVAVLLGLGLWRRKRCLR
jgi:PEP-CTERM motif-containing protein